MVIYFFWIFKICWLHRARSWYRLKKSTKFGRLNHAPASIWGSICLLFYFQPIPTSCSMYDTIYLWYIYHLKQDCMVKIEYKQVSFEKFKRIWTITGRTKATDSVQNPNEKPGKIIAKVEQMQNLRQKHGAKVRQRSGKKSGKSWAK